MRSHTLLRQRGKHAAPRVTRYLSVSLSASRSRREVRNAGGSDTGACAVLSRRLPTLGAGVLGAGVVVERWLSPRELAAVIRTSYAPHSRRELGARGVQARRPGWAGRGDSAPQSTAQRRAIDAVREALA